MRRVLRNGALLLIYLTAGWLFVETARAACIWEWVCDAAGRCEHVPLCDSPIEVFPPEPPSVPPVVGPRIRPVEVPPIPPVGTQHCEQRRVQGRWTWVCE